MKTIIFSVSFIASMIMLFASTIFAQGNSNGNSGNNGNSQNCVVSSINGPDQVKSGENLLFYVTSNGQHIWTFPAGVNVVGYGASGNDSVTVNFNQSFSSGTISVRRNGPSCVGVISSKLVSKITCEILVNLGGDRKTYFGYSPLECTLIQPIISKGTAPYSYNWSDGSTASSLNACLDESGDISLTVIDANGCEASDEMHICVTDVRCWAGNSNVQKVEVCHKNGKTLCVSSKAVETLVRIGGSLGSCSEKNNCDYINSNRLAPASNNSSNEETIVVLDTYVNSNKSIQVNIASFENDIDYQIVDLTGKVVKQGIISDGENSVDIHELNAGLYLFKAKGISNKGTPVVIK